MSKVKFTKGELKRRRDALRQYQRFLPTLQLKKQQLQIEILHLNSDINNKEAALNAKKESAKEWIGLFTDSKIDISTWVRPQEVKRSSKNVAGVDIPIFEDVLFRKTDYDLYIIPLWVDAAVDNINDMIKAMQEIETIKEGIEILRAELRVTTQRVNLFEKVKIPETKEAIRLIKIYIGDQLANAVGRSKIAKRKIEAYVLKEAII